MSSSLFKLSVLLCYNIAMSNGDKKLKLPVGWENDDLSVLSSLQPAKESWHENDSEGQLSVDVAQTEADLIIVATMAGTPPDKIELHLHNDLLTIRGERTPPIEESASYFYQESFWGKFSRTIILPVNVKSELAQAQYKNGVLIIRLPKSDANSEIPIMVIEE